VPNGLSDCEEGQLFPRDSCQTVVDRNCEARRSFARDCSISTQWRFISSLDHHFLRASREQNPFGTLRSATSLSDAWKSRIRLRGNHLIEPDTS
jgi:hypothetical protein